MFGIHLDGQMCSSHTYLALFDDPLDSIWHHMRVEFQAATQYSETWEVAAAVFHRATTKSRTRESQRNGLYSLEVAEHVSSTEQHGCRVGNIPPHSLCKRVACPLKKRWDTSKLVLCSSCGPHLVVLLKQSHANIEIKISSSKTSLRTPGGTYSLKHSILCTVAFPGNNSCTSNQPSCQVINDVAIEVRHYKNIKLVWILDQLQQKEDTKHEEGLDPSQKINTGWLREDVDTCMQQLSMIMLSYLILGYSSATSAQLWRNRPSPNFLEKDRFWSHESNWVHKSHLPMSQHVKKENALTWYWPCEQLWLCFGPFWWHNRRQTWRCVGTFLWLLSSNTQSLL